VPKEPAHVQKLESDLEKLEEKWKNSVAAEEIAKLLNTHAKQKTNDTDLVEEFSEFLDLRGIFMNTVTNVMGIGLGNLEENLLLGLHRKVPETSYFKFRTLVHIAQVLKKAQGKGKIEIFVQDPACKPLTRAMAPYLSKEHDCDIKIVQHPLGYLEMDDHTVLFHNIQYPMVTHNVADIALEVAGKMD
jgi:adenine-specific DNA methylase